MINSIVEHDKNYGTEVNPFQARINDALCCIEDSDGNAYGTGIRISDCLVITCYHVIHALTKGHNLYCRFDFYNTKYGRAADFCVKIENKLIAFAEAPSAPYLQNLDPSKLDYAVVRLERDPKLKLASDGGTRAWVPLPRNPVELGYGDKIEIYHHPGSALRDNRHRAQPQQRSEGRAESLLEANLHFWHNAHTADGSSGAPCFDSDGNFVAIHCGGNPVAAEGDNPSQIAVLIAPIVAHILQRFAQADNDFEIIESPPPKPKASVTDLDMLVKARLNAAQILMVNRPGFAGGRLV